MCKCCQLCLEDLYWQCCEEKYCYDESIANYDPTEDEYYKRTNGHVANGGESFNNNNDPITIQPSRLQRNISINSAKIHEDDVKREIQTANVNLPPEIIQVFANSQIFHDHKPLKSKPSAQQQPATFSIGTKQIEKSKLEKINEEGSNKLLQRLEQDESSSKSDNQQRNGKRIVLMSSTPPKIIETPAIKEEDEADSEVVLRPNRLEKSQASIDKASREEVWPAKPVNKRLQLDAPYFIQRPASENDISTISTVKDDRTSIPTVSSTSDFDFRFSMTPEVPSISFAHLPKNYLDTPSIEKFKKHEPTLLEIQTAEIRKSQNDFSMPRYYGKSDLILNRISLDPIGSGSNTSIASAVSISMNTKKHTDKSKRLKNIRAHLPPLTIHKDRSGKGEKEK